MFELEEISYMRRFLQIVILALAVLTAGSFAETPSEICLDEDSAYVDSAYSCRDG